MDALSDVLNAIRFKGTIYCNAELSAPWGIRVDSHPGHVGFLMLLRGGCLLEVEGHAKPLSLGPGDLILSPLGLGFCIKDSEDAAVVTISDLLPAEPTSNTRLVYGGAGYQTNLIMGCFQFLTNSRNPLLASLPGTLHIRAEDEPWLDMTFKFLAAETQNSRQGGAVIISRLADLLFIQGVRAHISQIKKCPETTGWLKALADPQIGEALSLIHANPQAPWTVASLASAVSMSRSSFAARFHHLTGTSPVEYVTSWRMQKAEELLRDGAAKPSEIASLIGYQSEAAFRKAFKRETGLTPGSVRRLTAV